MKTKFILITALLLLLVSFFSTVTEHTGLASYNDVEQQFLRFSKSNEWVAQENLVESDSPINTRTTLDASGLVPYDARSVATGSSSRQAAFILNMPRERFDINQDGDITYADYRLFRAFMAQQHANEPSFIEQPGLQWYGQINIDKKSPFILTSDREPNVRGRSPDLERRAPLLQEFIEILDLDGDGKVNRKDETIMRNAILTFEGGGYLGSLEADETGDCTLGDQRCVVMPGNNKQMIQTCELTSLRGVTHRMNLEWVDIEEVPAGSVCTSAGRDENGLAIKFLPRKPIISPATLFE